MITIISIENPVRSGPRQIDMLVKFSHFPDQVPFTASPDDPVEYGRLLYAAAERGDFGPVA